MEEILASIRRIISEDDAPADTEAEPAAAEVTAQPEPEPAAVAEPPIAFEPPPAPPAAQAEPEDEDEDEVLELTERVETVGDLDVYTPSAAPEEPEPAPAAPEPVAPEPAAAPPPIAESLVGAAAATAAASAFGKLSAAVSMPPDGQTLDGVVRDLLRPLLKDWLDANLPAIVQSAVQEEIERIARSRR